LTKSSWDIFFDLHGVLADVNAVNKNYGNYLERILKPVGLSQERVLKIHQKAFRGWLASIIRLFDDQKEGLFDSGVFMRNYRLIDSEWENFILDFVPLEHRKSIKPLLKTSLIEYEALAKGPYPILFPEVSSVLSELMKIGNLRMHVASSASSHHVKGAVVLHNLNDIFKELIGYDTVKAPKKASSGIYFKNILDIVNANPRYSIFVGDSIEEAIFSRKLGMNFIMVQRERSSPKKMIENSHFKIVSNLNEIIPIIQAWLN
jgi:phosphoglycolate phosphatase-like HAD superfamily hydrolase